MYTRRECLQLAAAAMMTGGRVRALGAPGDGGKPMRGAFMILTTPFTAAGAVDWDDLVREVDFCDRCGVHGVVWPQGSSGVRSNGAPCRPAGTCSGGRRPSSAGAALGMITSCISCSACRTSSGVPSSSSRLATRLLTALGVTASSLAACSKAPSLAAASIDGKRTSSAAMRRSLLQPAGAPSGRPGLRARAVRVGAVR